LDGERLDRVVAMLADVSRSVAATAISDRQVTIDGKVIDTRSYRVATDQVIVIAETVGEEPAPLVADSSVSVSVLYADDDVVVVDKQSGEIVHPGAGNETGTLVQGLLASYPEMIDVGQPLRPGVVHRLDKGTTGVLMFARSELAYDSLVGQLHDRSVQRRYLTFAWGEPEASDGVIDAPVGRAVRDPTRMVVRDDGKPARTRYRVEASWSEPAVALLSCELETGRTHQIRVHLEAIGHPVVGDTRYSGGRTGIELGRPALHAAELEFEHPVSGEWLTFVSPLPADMRNILVELGDPAWGSVDRV
jgi:23S rRNA pseudouridine1911/1915/1917 synthase